MRNLTLLATLVLLAVPSVAGAQSITAEPLIQKDISAALSYWHHSTGCARYMVETGPSVGYAQTELGGCTQVWNVEAWQMVKEALAQSPQAAPLWAGDDPSQRRLEYLRWSCELTIHEMGHTFGFPDENQSGTIMYRSSSPNDPAVPVCARAFPR